MAAKDKVILRGAGLYLARDKTGTFGSTALTAAAAAGASTLTVAAITNFSTSDWIRVGSGETAELIQVHASTAPTGNTITLATNLRKNHPIGDAVVERQIYDLGPATDQGVAISYRGDSPTLGVHDQRLPYAKGRGFVDMDARFSFPSLSLYNFAAALGTLLAKIVGSGTQASPLQLATDGTDIAGAGELDLIVVGKLFDNSDLVCYAFSVTPDYTQIRMPLTRGAFATLPVTYLAANGAWDTTVPAFAADVTNKPTKGKVWDALTAAGVFEDLSGGASTTVASGGAAGTSTFVVASATGIGTGDWLRLGVGNEMQILQVDGLVSTTVTVRGTLIRSLPVGTVVREQALNLAPAVDQDGAEFALSGTVERMRSALSRTSIGARPGAAEASFRIPFIDTTLAQIARVLGIPQAQVSGGRLLTDGVNILTSAEVNGVYLAGTLLDGSTWVAMGWGTDVGLSQGMEVLVNNTGKPNTVTLEAAPSAGLCFHNWT